MREHTIWRNCQDFNMLSEMYKNFVRREIKEISRHQFLQTQSFMAGAIVPKWKGEFIKKKKRE